MDDHSTDHHIGIRIDSISAPINHRTVLTLRIVWWDPRLERGGGIANQP